MRKNILVAMIAMTLMVGCGRGEAPVPTLDNPQSTIEVENIEVEAIEVENIEVEEIEIEEIEIETIEVEPIEIVTWDDATTYWEDVD